MTTPIQKKISITLSEWSIAQKKAKEDHFTSATAWIRYQIRKAEAIT